MTAPTKIVPGSRAVTTYTVKDSGDEVSKREQLNRILNALDSRVSAVEASESTDSSGSSSSYSFSPANFTTYDEYIALSVGGVSGTNIDFSSFDSDYINEGAVNLYFTDERAQDAVGGIVDSTLVYSDGTPSLGRAAITGDITISSGSNTAAISSGVIVNDDVNANAAIALTKLAATTASRALVSDGSGFITPATTTATEIGYINGLTASLQPQLNNLYYTQSTGLFYGGQLSINGGDNTKFDISAGAGKIVDYWTSPTSPPTVYSVSWGAFSAQTVTNLGSQTVTYIGIDSGGAIVQLSSRPGPDDKRQYIILGQLGHANLTNIATAISSPDIAVAPLNQLRDLADVIGVMSSGNIVSANGANLSINISSGTLTKLGSNFHTDSQQPSTLSFSAKTPATIRRRTQTGLGATGVTTLDPANYDDAGTITALVGTKYTNQYVYLLTSGNVVVQYGQYQYNNLAQAAAGIRLESFTVLENLVENAVLIGVISVRSTATDLSDESQALFYRASRFGESVAAAAGVSVSSLQSAYNNSTTPEITTDSTLGAVSIKRGSAADTDTVLEILNGSGTTTASITGAGAGAFTTLSTTGNVTLGDANTDTVTILGPLSVGKPSDHWSTSPHYVVGNPNAPLGQIDTAGSFRVSITSNGYRKGSSLWQSHGANGNTGAAQIELAPDGTIYFRTEASKATGSSSTITNRMDLSDSLLSLASGVNITTGGNITQSVAGEVSHIIRNTGSGSSYLRCTEGNYLGTFFEYDATNNIGYIGVHNSNDTNTANDIRTIALARAGTYVNLNPTTGVGIGLGNLVTPSATLHIESGVDPTIRLRDSSTTAGAYIELEHASNTGGTLDITAPSGNSVLFDINALPADGTSTATIRINRNTNTTGSSGLQIMTGNNTATSHVSMLTTSIVFNNNNLDCNTITRGLTDNSLLFVDAGADRVGIGTNTPSAKLDVAGDIKAVGDIRSAINSGACETVIPQACWMMLTADYTLTSSVSEQKFFNTSTNGTLTLPTGVYEFEWFAYLTGMDATSGNAAFDPVGAGTAVTDRWGQSVFGLDSNSPLGTGTRTGSASVTQQTNASAVTAATGTGMVAKITGMFRVSTGGTIIPSITLVNAAAAAAKAGSYFKIKRIGDSDETFVGAWT